MKKIFTLLLVVLQGARLEAQCTASGPNNPTDAISIPVLGKTSWFNAYNIFTGTSLYTISTALILGDSTQTLMSRGYGFAIPATAVICGIKVDIKKSRDGLKDNVRDGFVKLVKNGTIVGANRSKTIKWPKNDSIVSYGGATDLWGTTWTPANINAANFGVALSASLKTDLTASEFLSLPIFPIAKINRITVTVYYSSPLPVELLNFQAVCPDNTVVLSWTVASQTDNDFFTVERSENGKDYQQIGQLAGAGTSNLALSYTFTDAEDVLNEILYYRLKQTDFNGNARYFDPVTVECDRPESLVIYPNPATAEINIFVNRDANKNYALRIYDSYGFEVKRIDHVEADNTHIDRENLAEGIYIVRLEANGELVKAEKMVLK